MAGVVRLETNIQFREAEIQEVQAINDLVLEVFDKYIASGYSPAGQSTFRTYVNALLARLSEGISFCLVAILEGKIVGMIEVRNFNHISLLFVDDAYHKIGIAKKLVSSSIEKGKVIEIDVNSSPYAVNIYKRMGFQQLGEEQEKDGIRFIPMKKKVTIA